MKDIRILSAEECLDKAYGETIVQYSCDGVVSFAFSQVSVEKALEAPAALTEDLRAKLAKDEGKPRWSDLSDKLLEAICENPFDMHFIEHGDEGWSEEIEAALFQEVRDRGLYGAVTCGEDGALVTVYAGAMGSVDWQGHPYYGKACFEKTFPGFQQLESASGKEGLVLDEIKKEVVFFSSLLGSPVGPALDQHFEKNGWELQAWDTGVAQGYQLFFGKGVQVDNQYEYGFPYLYDKEELLDFAEEFYKNRVLEQVPSLDEQISTASGLASVTSAPFGEKEIASKAER